MFLSLGTHPSGNSTSGLRRRFFGFGSGGAIKGVSVFIFGLLSGIGWLFLSAPLAISDQSSGDI